jgi:hypothetical protein
MAEPFHSRSQVSSSIERYDDPASSSPEFPRLPASRIFRLSGLALLIGEVVNTVVWLPFSPFFTPSPFLSLILYTIGALSLLLAYSGLPGLHMRHAQRAGWLSLVSVILLCSNAVLYAMYVFLSFNFNQLPAILTSLFDTLGSLFIFLRGCGLILLGIAIIRASVFPRWTGVLFIASGVLLTVLGHNDLSDPLYYVLFQSTSILLCAAYLRCGYLLLQQRARPKG